MHAIGAGLYGLKPRFVARLRRVEDVAYRRGVTADAVTLLGLAVAMLTALVLVAGISLPLLWLAVPPLCLLRMACNAIDGSLARRLGTTRRGAVLNEVADRAADMLTFAALAPAVGWALALAVVVVALATSYAAVVGQAMLGARTTVGPLGKPDRVGVLSLSAIAAACAGTAAFVVGAWCLVVAGTITIGRRVTAVWRAAGDAA